MKICAERFIEDLKAKNLNYQVGEAEDGDVCVDFPYQGKVTKCFFSGDEGEYLSLYLVYERVPEDKVADVIFLCNELNCRYKWVTYYVDKDKDLMLHNDAILTADTAAKVAFELLVRLVKIAEDQKPTIMKVIYA